MRPGPRPAVPELCAHEITVKDFHPGYPTFATFLDSDESFTLYRRFGYLQSRLLLDQQDELRCLEAQLDELDKSEENSRPDSTFTREGQGQQRQEILSLVKTKFCDYGR